MFVDLACIVEGDGDVDAVPIALRRIAQEVDPSLTIKIHPSRARKVRPDLPISVVLAKREFEGWFLASAESLRGLRGLASDLKPPSDPESIRGTKEWLTARMTTGRSCVETLDQPALAASFDLLQARAAPSFDKFFRDVVAIVEGFAVR